MNILLVDDDENVTILLKNYLIQWGHFVTSLNSAEEALTILKKQDFDILICDWMMPEMNGIELIQIIRSSLLDTYLYIILLTSLEGKDSLIKGIELGADDFISKPFNKEELKVRIHAGARILKLQRELEQKNENFRLDLESAAELQFSILPSTTKSIAGLDFKFRFIPSFYIAGDVFNFIEYNPNEIIFYTLDVSGHGARAAMLSFTLYNLLNPFIENSILIHDNKLASPEKLFERLQTRFEKLILDQTQYFTLAFGIYSIDKQELRFGIAGHPALLFYSKENQTLEFKGGESSPIGLVSSPLFYFENLKIDSGDRLYLYSDGVVECKNSEGKQYTRENLKKELAYHTKQPIEYGIDCLTSKLNEFKGKDTFEDDITMVGVEFW
ncbi:MAG: hypothetical protein CK427_10360 [Leptospira sp.]|nr:MAG: hypothetical protein CK427_10360 [Leptospira sp.]